MHARPDSGIRAPSRATPLAAGAGHPIAPLPVGFDQLPHDQRVRDVHAKFSGEMLVTTARVAELAVAIGAVHTLRARFGLAAGRTEGGQRFERGRDGVAGQTVVAVLALAFDGDQRRVEQFSQVKARGLRRNIADERQFPRRQGSAVDECRQHRGAHRLTNQPRNRRDL